MLVALLGAFPLLILNGCPTGNGDCGEFGCGDDDDDDDAFECPGDWWGFTTPIEEWMTVGVLANGDADFQIGQRNFDQYDIIVGGWDENMQAIAVVDRPGLCFTDMGGMFLGDGDAYDESLFSVSFALESDAAWSGGTIQVVPTDGSDPYPIGEPNSVRGTAIEPDLEGGFVVCGSLEADVDNAVIWVDFDGTILAKDEMPSGSCYDLILAEDGTYYVTDPVAGKVYNYDLEIGEFAVVGDLPGGGGIGGDDWAIGEAGDGTLYLGDDVQIHTMDPETGATSSYTTFATLGTNGAHLLRFNWSEQLGKMTASSVLKDLESGVYVGPHTGAITILSGQGSHPYVVWNDSLVNGDLIVDFEIIDLQDFIDAP